MEKAKFKPGEVVHLNFTGVIIGMEFDRLKEAWEYTIMQDKTILRMMPESCLVEEQKEGAV